VNEYISTNRETTPPLLLGFSFVLNTRSVLQMSGDRSKTHSRGPTTQVPPLLTPLERMAAMSGIRRDGLPRIPRTRPIEN
jgi:hypothetical protein